MATGEHLRVYKQYYGPVPAGCEVHHVNGDHANNHPLNLAAIPLWQHYNVHLNRGDFSQCLLMAHRMGLDKRKKSMLASLASRKLVACGKHPFLGPAINRRMNKLRRKSGRHPFINGSLGRTNIKKLLAANRHPSQIWRTCPHCLKRGNGATMLRWHFDRCRAPRQTANTITDSNGECQGLHVPRTVIQYPQ
jgi:hypothetical protein